MCASLEVPKEHYIYDSLCGVVLAPGAALQSGATRRELSTSNDNSACPVVRSYRWYKTPLLVGFSLVG